MTGVRPTREEFRALADGHDIVPVWREVLADLTTPVSAFARLVGDDEPGFLLESVEHGEHWGRFSFVGRRPLATLVARGGSLDLEVTGDLPHGTPTDRGILAAAEHLLENCRTPPAPSELPPFHAGLMGYLGYDVVREVEHLPAVPPDPLELPDAVLSLVGQLAVFDHYRQRAILVANVTIPQSADPADIDACYDAALAGLEELAADGSRLVAEPLLDPPGAEEALPEVVSTMGGGAYERAVDGLIEFVKSGDIFQCVLAQRFEFDLEADPFDLYRVLRQVNPSPYMYFVQHPEVTLAGCSPEPMVQLLDGKVISRPIAGTRYRGETPEADRLLEAELVEHPKEIAEHVMLVDLARNDLGRVVEFGTETVDDLMVVERYSHVMHLTSQVSGALAEGRSSIDVLRATLPAGTVSGAPKVRAMQLIDEFEPVKRGPYAGVVGYLDFSGNIDTALAIRTMVIRPDGKASVQAGAGIVADSVPAHEALECRNKARALLSAVEPARRMTAERRRRSAAIEGSAGRHSGGEAPAPAGGGN